MYQDIAFSAFDMQLLAPNIAEASVVAEDLSDAGVKVTLLDTSMHKFFTKVTTHLARGHYDLVHSHGFTSGVACALPCILFKRTHLVTSHDVIVDGQYVDFKGRLFRHLIAQSLRSAAAIHAVGAEARDNLAFNFGTVGGLADKLEVITNGIDSKRFLEAQPIPDLRRQLGIPDSALLVGFFGRFMSQKGFRYLIDAMALQRERDPDSPTIVVLAVGGGGFRREEEDAIHRRDLAAYFRFKDFVPDASSLMRSVDVIAVPSLWEACALVPMEAMTVGIPLVATDCDTIVPLAHGSPTRIVPRRDPHALLQGLHEMASPSAREAARRYQPVAAERFDVRRTRKEIAALYKRLTQDGVATRGVRA